jgi:HEAT repeat protein
MARFASNYSSSIPIVTWCAPNRDVRPTAISFLGRYGAEAQDAISALQSVLGSSDEKIRAAAQDSMLKIQQEQKPGP